MAISVESLSELRFKKAEEFSRLGPEDALEINDMTKYAPRKRVVACISIELLDELKKKGIVKTK